MISSAVFSTALMLLGPSAGQATEGVEPLRVYLFARIAGEPLTKSEKKAREQELKSKKKEAKQARKELDKEFKAQFGKDRDDWPEEQQEEYGLAEEAEPMAQFELDYLKYGAFADGLQYYLDDSVGDVAEAIQGKYLTRKKKWISLVENRDQAHLLVEVFDRADVFVVGEENTLRVAVRVFPGEALSSNQLDGIIPKDGWARAVEVKHAFRKEEPYWIFECRGEYWRDAAASVAGTIDAFIKDNRAVLMGDAPTQ